MSTLSEAKSTEFRDVISRLSELEEKYRAERNALDEVIAAATRAGKDEEGLTNKISKIHKVLAREGVEIRPYRDQDPGRYAGTIAANRRAKLKKAGETLKATQDDYREANDWLIDYFGRRGHDAIRKADARHDTTVRKEMETTGNPDVDLTTLETPLTPTVAGIKRPKDEAKIKAWEVAVGASTFFAALLKHPELIATMDEKKREQLVDQLTFFLFDYREGLDLSSTALSNGAQIQFIERGLETTGS